MAEDVEAMCLFAGTKQPVVLDVVDSLHCEQFLVGPQNWGCCAVCQNFDQFSVSLKPFDLGGLQEDLPLLFFVGDHAQIPPACPPHGGSGDSLLPCHLAHAPPWVAADLLSHSLYQWGGPNRWLAGARLPEGLAEGLEVLDGAEDSGAAYGPLELLSNGASTLAF